MLPSYQVSSRLAFCFERRSNKIDFQDGSHGMLISDWNYFYFFDPRFKSTDLSVQEKKRKNKLSRWCSWRPAWIADRKDF